MVEMITGTHPWPNINDNFPFFFKLIHLKEGDMPEFKLDETASDELRVFFKLVFSVDYAKRPSSDQLLEHAWFKC